MSFAAGENAIEATVWTRDRSVLECSPKFLTDRQSLVLTLGKRHGSELAIRRVSDNSWYFLVVRLPPSDMKMLMTPEEFSAATRIEFPTTATGYNWRVDGRNERIFTVPGQYSVYSSNVLESEEGGYTCTIDYRK